MRQHAIVIGATGLIGSALLKQLIANKAFSQITAISRRPIELKADTLHNVVTDFDQLDAVRESFTGDCLFCCMGTTRKQAGSLAAQYKVDVDYPLQAARLAREQGVKHFLLVSSMSANSGSRSAYLRMKGELEDGVRALAFERLSIFQPSLLLGERQQRRTGEYFAGKVMPSFCLLPGLRRYRPISGDQVAQSMIARSLNAGPAQETFSLDEIFPKE